ncbi:hypothetical protein [Flavihumibacter petaseus]|uniref:Uncharacterized protein n=1 Tax=Flavihumibacter petaseus NBRC 106054 TaxID=1220578 RepID=A0A0E9MV03_9BACT|nr:hypothetical protein [Flavihumibacter petaseus]GAO41577.1 hypothetical protein FPE01S_01_05910 [Flavihumibacter petaseus NBRC 106054]
MENINSEANDILNDLIEINNEGMDLKTAITIDVRALIKKQKVELKSIHDKIRLLRDSHK